MLSCGEVEWGKERRLMQDTAYVIDDRKARDRECAWDWKEGIHFLLLRSDELNHQPRTSSLLPLPHLTGPNKGKACSPLPTLSPLSHQPKVLYS